MDSNFSKQGCPKGSKDGPHPPGTPPHGCPKKSVGKDPKTSQGELSPFPSGTGKLVSDNWYGFPELEGNEGLTDVYADDEFGFGDEEMTAEQLAEMDCIEREANFFFPSDLLC